MTKKQKQAFISKVAKAVKKYALSYGIKVCSPVIAQAILESGWGESKLAAEYHNYFGLKCGTLWKGKSVNMKTQEEYEPGVKTTISDNFRVYGSLDDGVKGYFEFIQLARYQNLKGITDPRKYVETIKADGYATSSTYVDLIMKLIEENDLTKYDPTGQNMDQEKGAGKADGKASSKVADKADIEKAAQDVIAGNYGNGEDRKTALRAAGYDYEAVQKKVNELVAGLEKVAPDGPNDKMDVTENKPEMAEGKLAARGTGKKTADALVSAMRSWIGFSEANGKYRQILDLYNSHKPLARGYAIQPGDAWCATTVSAAAIQAGMTDLIGTEVSCGHFIQIFQEKGIWIEDGTILPKPGYIILYNWDDGTQPNDGWADHIGVVEAVNNGQITVIEGNYQDSVGRRTIPVGWGYIRGYAAPKYENGGSAEGGAASSGGGMSTSAAGGDSGIGATVTPQGRNGEARPLNVNPRWKGKVTASALNVRSWAGMEYNNIKSVPILRYGDPVEVCDTLQSEAGEKWHFVRINGRVYGFVHGSFIARG